MLRNRVRTLVGMAHTPHWNSDHGVNTRSRIRCLGTFGMEPADAEVWRDRAREIDRVSKREAQLYVQELDDTRSVVRAAMGWRTLVMRLPGSAADADSRQPRGEEEGEKRGAAEQGGDASSSLEACLEACSSISYKVQRARTTRACVAC